MFVHNDLASEDSSQMGDNETLLVNPHITLFELYHVLYVYQAPGHTEVPDNSRFRCHNSSTYHRRYGNKSGRISYTILTAPQNLSRNASGRFGYRGVANLVGPVGH